jgi:hypothetical protein
VFSKVMTSITDNITVSDMPGTRFCVIPRPPPPPKAGPTQLRRVYPAAGGWRLSLSDEGRPTL